MTGKYKGLILIFIMLAAILCISGLVYAASSKIYQKKTPSGTFVFQEITTEDDENGYLYQTN